MPNGSLGSPADAIGALAVVGHKLARRRAGFLQQPGADDRRLHQARPDRTGTGQHGHLWRVRRYLGRRAYVAGAAALVLSAYPNLDVRGLRDFLTSRALDAGPAGPDNAFGTGRLSLQQTPTVAVRTTGVAMAIVHAVRLAHDQTVGGVRGVMVYTDFSVTGLSDLDGTIVARFSDTAGRPLADGNGQYTDATGGAYVGAAFHSTPARRPHRRISALHALCRTGVTSRRTHHPGHRHHPRRRRQLPGRGRAGAMVVRQMDSRSHVTFAGPIRIHHSVEHDGMIGIDILVDFNAPNFAGQTATMAAYFYYDDTINTPLLDFNQQYCTRDSIVAACRRFTPGTWPRPSSATSCPVHALPRTARRHGARYNLKLHVIVWDETTGETLGISDWGGVLVRVLTAQCGTRGHIFCYSAPTCGAIGSSASSSLSSSGRCAGWRSLGLKTCPRCRPLHPRRQPHEHGRHRLPVHRLPRAAVALFRRGEVDRPLAVVAADGVAGGHLHRLQHRRSPGRCARRWRRCGRARCSAWPWKARAARSAPSSRARMARRSWRPNRARPFCRRASATATYSSQARAASGGRDHVAHRRAVHATRTRPSPSRPRPDGLHLSHHDPHRRPDRAAPPWRLCRQPGTGRTAARHKIHAALLPRAELTTETPAP